MHIFMYVILQPLPDIFKDYFPTSDYTTLLACPFFTFARINAVIIALLQGQQQALVARKVMQSCRQDEGQTVK